MRVYTFIAVISLGLLGILAGAPRLRAELVIDDFDDPVAVTTPEMRGDSIVTEDVGVFTATRTFRIADTTGTATRSRATLDADISITSLMTADLSTAGAEVGGGRPLFAFQFAYSFSPHDVSEGGANDAIIFHFRSIRGTGYVPELGVIARDDFNLRESYFAAIRDLPVASGPFIASIPFSSFTQRGGAPGLPDFTTITRLDFDFFFLFPPLNTQWSAEIERIRFGRIPEPPSLMLCLGAAPWLIRRGNYGTSNF